MKTLYVNYAGSEKRVAIEEKKKLLSFYGNVMKSKRLLGIFMLTCRKNNCWNECTFVNIGLEKHAYLSYDDVPSSYRIHEGQAILVQVVKEAIDTKGPKLTANIEFTGKYVVYMPFDEMRAVSRKIKNNKKKTTVTQIEIEGMGIHFPFCF